MDFIRTLVLCRGKTAAPSGLVIDLIPQSLQDKDGLAREITQ